MIYFLLSSFICKFCVYFFKLISSIRNYVAINIVVCAKVLLNNSTLIWSNVQSIQIWFTTIKWAVLTWYFRPRCISEQTQHLNLCKNTQLCKDFFFTCKKMSIQQTVGMFFLSHWVTSQPSAIKDSEIRRVVASRIQMSKQNPSLSRNWAPDSTVAHLSVASLSHTHTHTHSCTSNVAGTFTDKAFHRLSQQP